MPVVFEITGPLYTILSAAGLGCVTHALVHAGFMQPSPHIFLHFCTVLFSFSKPNQYCDCSFFTDLHFHRNKSLHDALRRNHMALHARLIGKWRHQENLRKKELQ